MINIIGLIVFLGIAVLFSSTKRYTMEIDYYFSRFKLIFSVVLHLLPMGKSGIKAAANGISWVMNQQMQVQDLRLIALFLISRWIWLLAHYFQFY